MSDDERRGEPRVATNIEVDYAADTTFLFASIRDISTMGIFVHTDTPVAVGTRLALRFSPPAEVADKAGGGDPFEVSAEVAWNTEGTTAALPGMGLRFVDLVPNVRSRLLSLVRAITYLDDRE